MTATFVTTMPRPDTFAAKIKEWATDIGFDRVRICPAIEAQGFHHLLEWLELGYAGEMQFFRDRQQAYRHPRHVLDGARSLIVLAMNYGTSLPVPTGPGMGRISRYAWGDRDYHDVIHNGLKRLVMRIQQDCPGCRARGIVDTAPLLEREFAQLAGMGWVGKHTLLLNREFGSYFFLAAVLLDQELAYDDAGHVNYCGSCTACLDACPTQAFPQPYVLDATRCISYLTIEHRSSIPTGLRPMMGDWIFGCDICQDVCPWNRRAPTTNQPGFQPQANGNPVELARLFELDESAFRQQYRHSALWRAKRRGLLRNAAIALGNRPCPSGLKSLCQAIDDEEPLVREAAAWALSRHLEWPEAEIALQRRLTEEEDSIVLEAIRSALQTND
jgi:epoxyqueuosine reductase